MIILSGIIYFVIVFLMLMGWKYRKLGIFAWRTGCAVSMLRVIQICLTPDPLLVLNEAYTFQLMIIGFIIMPLLPQVSVCDSCGRRIYWRPLFRSRCSHCGEKLYYSVSNNYKREQAYFFCSSYRKNSEVCSAHYIREKVVEQIVLESMQRILLNVQVFEKEFARKQMDCYTEDKKKQLAAKRRELSKAKKRIAEIDTLIQRIYEDNASGKLSDERYATLSLSYEEEQKTLKAAIPKMQVYLEDETNKTESLQRFIQKVKQITELKALTPELIHEFVDKIVVYAPRYLDGKRVQLLDIYYSGVGILHELTPEEMEEAFQHHLAERSKEKTA